MVLDMPGGLFGERNLLVDTKKFSVGRPQTHRRIVMPGWAVIGAASFLAGGLQNFKDNAGFVTTVNLMNESGANRNSTIVITNTTTGKTLLSGNVTLPDGGFFNTSYYWSLEFIKPGDGIQFAIGNEGVGTAVENSTAAYYEFELNGVFGGQDESSD